jgi:hypothetical protein
MQNVECPYRPEDEQQCLKKVPESMYLDASLYHPFIIGKFGYVLIRRLQSETFDVGSCGDNGYHRRAERADWTTGLGIERRKYSENSHQKPARATEIDVWRVRRPGFGFLRGGRAVIMILTAISDVMRT